MCKSPICLQFKDKPIGVIPMIYYTFHRDIVYRNGRFNKGSCVYIIDASKYVIRSVEPIFLFGKRKIDGRRTMDYMYGENNGCVLSSISSIIKKESMLSLTSDQLLKAIELIPGKYRYIMHYGRSIFIPEINISSMQNLDNSIKNFAKKKNKSGKLLTLNLVHLSDKYAIDIMNGRMVSEKELGLDEIRLLL